MSRWLLPILDIGTGPADDPDLVVRKRTAVAIILVTCVASSMYGILGLATGRPVVAQIAVLQTLGMLLSLALFYRTRLLAPVVLVMWVLGLLTVFSGVLSLGGLALSASNVVWGVLAPMGAVLLLGGRAGIPAYLGLVLIVLSGVLLDPHIPKDQVIPHPVAVVVTAFNVLLPAAIALALVVYIDGQRVAAKRESDALLLNVLPDAIARRLKAGERVIADHYDAASVLFADIVDFTALSESKAPQDVVGFLNRLFTEFDRQADRFGLEKIKTMGDAYMVVAGVPRPRDDHAVVLVEMALAMQALVRAERSVDGRPLRLRVGIASGPLVAGVIGERKFSYDLWGDTVNTAARMETAGVPGYIQVTEETRRLLGGRYPFVRREGVEVKGKGLMATWILDPASLSQPYSPRITEPMA